jgi:hypothetical protein
MIWNPPQASGADNSIFTGVLFNVYSAPATFSYDQFSKDVPIMDDPLLQGYNLDRRAWDLVYYMRNVS